MGVILMVIFLQGTNNRPFLFTQEFNNFTKCEVALKEVRNAWQEQYPRGLIKAVCLPK